MRPLNPFATMRNKKGAIRYSCLNLLIGLNSSVRLPFTNIEINEDFKQATFHDIYLELKPILLFI